MFQGQRSQYGTDGDGWLMSVYEELWDKRHNETEHRSLIRWRFFWLDHRFIPWLFTNKGRWTFSRNWAVNILGSCGFVLSAQSLLLPTNRPYRRCHQIDLQWIRQQAYCKNTCPYCVIALHDTSLHRLAFAVPRHARYLSIVSSCLTTSPPPPVSRLRLSS